MSEKADTGEPERTDEELQQEELEDVSGGLTMPVGSAGSGFPEIAKTPAGITTIPTPYPNTTESSDDEGTINPGAIKLPDGDGSSSGG